MMRRLWLFCFGLLSLLAFFMGFESEFSTAAASESFAAGTEARIDVLVIDEGGSPLEEIGLYVNYNGDWNHPNSSWIQTATDGTGSYAVPEPGVYWVGPGYQIYDRYPFLISPPGEEVDVQEGEVEFRQFTMTEGGLVEGWLKGEGKDVEGGVVQVLHEGAGSVYEVFESKGLYAIEARPDGIDYWISLPPGRYLVYAVDVIKDWGDTFGFCPEFAFQKYSLALADVVEISDVRQRVRVDFDLTRGARVDGTLTAVSSGASSGAAGIRVQFLKESNREKIGEVLTSWGGDPSHPAGSYWQALPAGQYLLRFSPTVGSPYLDSGFYTGETSPLTTDPEQAEVINLDDWDETTIDFTFNVFPRTIGDIDLDGSVDPKDVFLLGTVWQESPIVSDTAVKGSLNEDDVIDEKDLLLWWGLFRRYR